MAADPFNYSGKLAFLRGVCVDSRLQRTAVAVAAVLIDYANTATGIAYPSVRRIVDESGVPKTTALRALRRLEEYGWITSEKRFGAQSRYTLAGPDSVTGSGSVTGAIWNKTGAIQNLQQGKTGPDSVTEPVPMVAPEQNKAESNRKEQTVASAANALAAPTPVLPNWIDRAAWDGFVEARKKNPMTSRAANLVIRELEKLRADGHKPTDVLDQSTRNGWRDVFPVRPKREQEHASDRRLSAVERVQAHNAANRRERGEGYEYAEGAATRIAG